MANHASSEKRIRQTKRRNAVNVARKTRVRAVVKSLETSLSKGEKTNVTEQLRTAQSELMRAAGKGVYNKRAASRKVSRLNARAKALVASKKAAS